MKLIVLLFVGWVLYAITRNYKTEDYNNINIDTKENFTGDISEHEAGLLVAMMAKVAKADGNISELEAEVLSHTFTDISSYFKNDNEVREQLKDIFKKEKESFENVLDIANKYYNLSKRDYSKRILVMEYLINIACIDGDFSHTEVMICEDIANALKIKKANYDAIVNKFETFYQNQANNKATSLQDAYKILNSEENQDFKTIKKNYRDLVKQYHPDIVTGRGANQSTIDDANRKLQEINEAYEVIKTHLGK